VSIHAGSYDDALKDARIANLNLIRYSSVLPPEAVERPQPPALHHGAVLETIHAEMSGSTGEVLTAGLITWRIKALTDESVVGGFVAEYAGHALEETARNNLQDAMEGMNERRGYARDYFEIFDVNLMVKSFTPKKKYGTVIVALGFFSWIYPRLEG
jgi:arginine decarboxylase